MPKINSNVKERRERILKFIRDAGAWKISPAVVKKLAEEFKVSERQIYMDFKEVIKKIPKPKVDDTGKKFLISWEYAIDKSIELMRHSDPDIAAKGVKLFFEASDKFTNFMYQYGFKEKIENKLNIEIKGKNILAELMEECKDGNESTDSHSSSE